MLPSESVAVATSDTVAPAFTVMSVPAATAGCELVTATFIVSVAVPPSLSVVVSWNVSVVDAATDGVTTLALALAAFVIVTAGPAGGFPAGGSNLPIGSRPLAPAGGGNT